MSNKKTTTKDSITSPILIALSVVSLIRLFQIYAAITENNIDFELWHIYIIGVTLITLILKITFQK